MANHMMLSEENRWHFLSFVLIIVHLMSLSSGCGEIRIKSELSRVAGTWSLYHEQRNHRPTFRRVSLQAGRKSSPSYLYHNFEGKWVIGSFIGDQLPSVFVNSWALSPLMISSLDGNATWFDRVESLYLDIVDISCSTKPMSMFVSSKMNPSLGGVYLPTGKRSFHAHIYDRIGLSFDCRVAGRRLTLQYDLNGREGLPELSRSRGRWELVDSAESVLAFVDVDIEEDDEEIQNNQSQTDGEEEELLDLSPHLEGLSSPRRHHLSEEEDRPPASSRSSHWMTLQDDGWVLDPTITVEVIFDQVDKRHIKGVGATGGLSDGAVRARDAYVKLRRRMAGGGPAACTPLSNGLCLPKIGFSIAGVSAIKSLQAALLAGYPLVDTQAPLIDPEVAGFVLKMALEKRWKDSGDTDVWVTAAAPLHLGDNLHQIYDEFLSCLSLYQRPQVSLLVMPASLFSEDWRLRWRVMERLYGEGKVLALGVSCFQLRGSLASEHLGHLKELLQFAAVPPCVVQGDLDPLTFMEGGGYPMALTLCSRQNITFQATSLLHRSVSKEVDVEPTDEEVLARFEYLEVRKELASAGRSLGRSPFQILVKWCLEVVGQGGGIYPLGVSVIFSSASSKHLKTDLDVFDWSMPLSAIGPALWSPLKHIEQPGLEPSTIPVVRRRKNKIELPEHRSGVQLDSLRTDVLASQTDHALQMADTQRQAIRVARATRIATQAAKLKLLEEEAQEALRIGRWARWKRVVFSVLVTFACMIIWMVRSGGVTPPEHAGLGSPRLNSPPHKSSPSLSFSNPPRRISARSVSDELPMGAHFSLDRVSQPTRLRPHAASLDDEISTNFSAVSKVKISNLFDSTQKIKEW